jgi:acetoin utilization deacetylase AcuC-like enzyme
MHAYYADHFVLPLPQGHRFPMQKFAMLRERLVAQMHGIEMHEALPASADELKLVHTPDLSWLEYQLVLAHANVKFSQERLA